VPQIETPICTRRTTTHQFFWWQQHRWGAVGGSSMECGIGGQPHKTPYYTGTHLPVMTLPRKSWVRFNRLRTGVGLSAPACTNGVWSPLRPVSVGQNKPWTLSSSTVQAIDLPTDYTAWRFWTMKQPNGCSTPASMSRQASSGQKKNSLKRKKKKKLLFTFCLNRSMVGVICGYWQIYWRKDFSTEQGCFPQHKAVSQKGKVCASLQHKAAPQHNAVSRDVISSSQHKATFHSFCL